MGRRNKKKPPKQIKVQVIDRLDQDGKVRQPYRIMERMIPELHSHLVEAKICLAWKIGCKPDADGHVMLGQARKASDLDRELHTFDFVILLNFEAWNAAGFNEEQMTALIDHELCHCQVTLDNDTGEEKRDAKGHPVWRIRKHDIEEFCEIVGRHGLWKKDLEKFARVAMEKAAAPLTSGALRMAH